MSGAKEKTTGETIIRNVTLSNTTLPKGITTWWTYHYSSNNGYKQSKHTPGFWTHESRPICFSLVVDDFGVKYVGEDNAKHLIQILEEYYDLSKDWHGTVACRWIGTTRNKKCIYLCPDRLKKLWHDSNMPKQENSKTSPTSMQFRFTAQRYNMQKKLTRRNF